MLTMDHSPEFLKRRKFLLVLPILIIPFVTALFFLLGGGQGTTSTGSIKTAGLNMLLPDAHFNKKRDPNKMALYESVNEDSARWKSAVKDDPYRKDSSVLSSMSFEHSQALEDILNKTADKFPGDGFDKLNISVNGKKPIDHSKELSEKINRLKEMVNAKPVPPTDAWKSINNEKMKDGSLKTDQAASILGSKASVDPDLVQLDKMLDKIVAIQHPDMQKDSIAAKVKVRSLPVEKTEGENAIAAIIPEKQVLISGATIRIQIMDSAKIAGISIVPGQFIYGTAMLSNERLKIQVRSFRTGHSIAEVNLNVYDLDGMEGIYIPGSMSRDVSKQSLEQGISGLGLTAVDPSIGAQAANAGIQAAKTLMSRKVKMVEVTIPAGYGILLKSEQ